MDVTRSIAVALAALSIAASPDPIADLRAGNVESVQKAIADGKLAPDGADPAGKPLLLVAYEADRLAVGKLLLRGGADPNVAGPGGQPLLHEVVTAGKAAWVDALLASHRLDVNVPDAEGATPLLVAMRRGDMVAIDALLARGANPVLADGRSMVDTVGPREVRERVDRLLRAEANPSAEEKAQALAAARSNGAAALTALLARRPGLRNFQTEQGETILMAAVAAGAADAVHALLDRGADLRPSRQVEARFVTALDLARDPAIAALLRAHGARPTPKRSAEVIIAAGAKTPEELAPILAELKEVQFPFAQGFPVVVLSDRVPGLKPGWYVVLVGTCPEGPLARAWAASFREGALRERKDAYTRPVTLETARFACPGHAGQELPSVKVDAAGGMTLVAQAADRWPVSVELHDAKGALVDWKWTANPPDERVMYCEASALRGAGEAVDVDYRCYTPGCTQLSSTEYRATWSVKKGKLRVDVQEGKYTQGECDD